MTPVLAMELEHRIDAPEGALYAPSTSVAQVTVVGAGVTENSNIDRSKNAAVIPPPFGSPESSMAGTGTVLTPQTSTTVSSTTSLGIQVGSSDTAYYLPAEMDLNTTDRVTTSTSNAFTLPDGLFYADGSLGTLKIPTLNLSVKVYEDESLENLAKGVGHFKSTSCWDGNVGFAAHNRGRAEYFGKIHTLENGDKIKYTTRLGTRTYEVFYVGKISETDFSRLGRTKENMVTLITCVRDVPELRWCVQAREIS